MANIRSVVSGHYRIPLDVALTASTHGVMTEFEVVTVCVTDEEGVGYTYATERNGSAIYSIIKDEIGAVATGHDADRIEQLWEQVWWELDYGGRGGPSVIALSAYDIALWDLKGKRAKLLLWNLLGGHNNRVTC